MIDETSEPITIKSFGGANTATDPAEVPVGYALIARNCEYFGGDQVMTRTGFNLASASFSAEAVTSMFNWISSLGNYLVRFRSSDRTLRIDNITTPAAGTSLFGTDLVGYATTHANAGARLYSACFNTSGRGAIYGIVSSYQSAAFVTDPILQGPVTYTPSAPTEPGAGVVTAGIHRIGYRIEYRSGFVTRPSPDSGVGTPSSTTFQPIVFTATGAKNCRVVLNFTWPSAAVKVHLIMTPTDNLNRYIMVPGANAAVNGGTLQSITIDINISDDDLLGSSNIDEVSDSLNFLTNTTGTSTAWSGTAPFNPYVVFTHGDRMVYITTILDNVGNATGAAFVSDLGHYQQISADQNLIQLPGLLDINTGFSLDGVMYLVGPQWTYRTTDNGSFPVTWATPALVDGRRGTVATRGVEVSPSGTYAWVADTTGLYLFTGAYPDLPISYEQGGAEWGRINWAVANTLVVKDYTDRKKVVVLAALDSATTPSHQLVWDYSSGKEYDAVRFSLDTIAGVSMNAMEIVQNTITGSAAANIKSKELWVGQSTAAGVYRSLSTADTNPWRDGSSGIDFQYRTSFFRPTDNPHIQTHQGMHARIKGAGSLAITAYNFDNVSSFGPFSNTLSASPGFDFFYPMDLLGEGVCYDFALNVADAHLTLSYLRHYTAPWAMQAT